MVSSAGLIVSLLSVFLPAALAYTSDAVKQNLALFDVPLRPLQPPFPNGCCGGTVVTLPPEDTFAIDTNLNGNTFLLPPRPIQVWLPPSYDDRSTCKVRHPVLFVHDGQNAMFDESSWTGRSWRLMGALTRMADRNMIRGETPIVVLLPSCAEHLVPGVSRRHLEYGDVSLPFSQAHADFVANIVKPLVDSTFKTDPQHACAMGTSLGGQASLHLLLRHPELFQGAACLSPCFQPTTIATTALQASKLKDKRIYLDMGGDVEDKTVPVIDLLDHATPLHWWNPGYWWLDTQLRPSLDAMRRVLESNDIPHIYEDIPGGRHNERAWSQRIDKPLLHLYGHGENKC
jgi:pimeloyl-ACP methyl ester carboxylesterase